MTVRAFIVLLVVTVFAVWVGDRVVDDFAAPGLEKSFAVLVVAAAIVAPVAWLLDKAGWIRGRLELGRRRTRDGDPPPAANQSQQRDGGRA